MVSSCSAEQIQATSLPALIRREDPKAAGLQGSAWGGHGSGGDALDWTWEVAGDGKKAGQKQVKTLRMSPRGQDCLSATPSTLPPEGPSNFPHQCLLGCPFEMVPSIGRGTEKIIIWPTSNSHGMIRDTHPPLRFPSRPWESLGLNLVTCRVRVVVHRCSGDPTPNVLTFSQHHP